VLVARAVHPNYRAVLRTYAEGLELTIDELPYAADGRTDLSSLDAVLAEQRYAAVVVQSPNFFGAIDALPPGAAERIRATKTVVIGVVAEAMSLAALATPASWARKSASAKRSRSGTRDRVRRTARRLHRGERRTPAAHPRRLAGKSVDSAGRTPTCSRCRRANSTSGAKRDLEHLHQPGPLRAVRDDLPGRDGQDRAAQLRRANVAVTNELACKASALAGYARRFEAPTFNEVAIRVPGRAADVLAELERRRILGGLDLGRFYPELADCILMTATELTSSAGHRSSHCRPLGDSGPCAARV